MTQVLCFDPTSSDSQSKVRGVGRYLQILKENFPEWTFSNTLHVSRYTLHTFINPFFNFLQKPLTLKKIAKKQIAVIHDLIPFKYPSHFPVGIKGSINILLNKLALKNHDLIVTDSEASKSDIVNMLHIREDKIKVIYPCLPRIFTKSGKRKMGLEAGQENRMKWLGKNQKSNFQFLNSFPSPPSNFCLYVGDATWNKNLVNLARAIKIANVTCIFVGKVFTNHQPLVTSHHSHPWQKEFKQFLKETKDDKRFIFTGFLSDLDLIKLYKQAELNILPSRDEGFGFSFLEAASQGCPSVLADIPVLKEISGHSLKEQSLKGMPLFVDQENPHDIADKIREIFFNKELRNALGKQAKKRSQFFSPNKFKNSFLKAILD